MQLAANFLSLEPMSQVNGCSGIVNFDGIGFSQMFALDTSIIRMIIEWAQRVIPVRLDEVVCVNTSFLFDVMLQIFSPFLEDDLRNAFYVENNFQNVARTFSAEILEKHYGGKLENGHSYGKQFYRLMENHLDEIKGKFKKLKVFLLKYL